MKSVHKSKLMVVEGTDEERFFEAALRRDLRLSNIQVIAYQGKSKLKGFLEALRLDPQFHTVTALAVLRDADDDPAGAFQSVAHALGGANLAVPGSHGAFSKGKPRVGVFILPDGKQPGMLETLCVNAVRSQADFHCVEAYFNCLRSADVVPANIHKAFAYAWLASRHSPGKRVGEAAQRPDTGRSRTPPSNRYGPSYA